MALCGGGAMRAGPGERKPKEALPGTYSFSER